MILAVDTSQLQSSICLLTKDGLILVDSIQGSTQASHSKSLLPLIDELLKRNKQTIAEIETYAVGVGPGSFTGIRIGCSTIKAFAQVFQKPILSFSSLKACYYSHSEKPVENFVFLQNAYQGMVFAGWFESAKWNEGAFTEAELPTKFDSKTIFKKDLPIINTGILQATLDSLNEKSFTDYSSLKANYLRPSQAEAKYSVLNC